MAAGSSIESGTAVATALSAMPTRAPRRPPVPPLRAPTELQARFAELESATGAKSIAVAICDFATREEFEYKGDRWFHAASTIKLAVLIGVYGAIYHGDL